MAQSLRPFPQFNDGLGVQMGAARQQLVRLAAGDTDQALLARSGDDRLPTPGRKNWCWAAAAIPDWLAQRQQRLQSRRTEVARCQLDSRISS